VTLKEKTNKNILCACSEKKWLEMAVLGRCHSSKYLLPVPEQAHVFMIIPFSSSTRELSGLSQPTALFIPIPYPNFDICKQDLPIKTSIKRLHAFEINC
jgi:hypothetical protein